MAFATLITLALLAAGQAGQTGFDTAPAAPAPAEQPVLAPPGGDAPPATSAGEVPLATGQSQEDQARADAAAAGDPIPAGAPTDDYNFVGWCSGALSEHIALRSRVWPDVERIERQFPDPDTPIDQVLAGYDDQQKEGEQELALFNQALDAAAASAGADRAGATESGRKIWRGAATTDTRQLAQLWMSWALPSRCQATANKLLGR